MASLLESDMADKAVNEGGSFLRLSPPIYLLSTRHGARRSFRRAFAFTVLRNRTGPLVPDLARPTSGMADPDPPPNSLGLDIAQSEPASDAQSTLANPPSPSPQSTTQSFADATDSVATDTPASPTTPATGTDNVDKVEDATKPNVPKKTPYVNPERVKTGGLPRVKLVSL